ncbi:MAG: hypothetical protein K5769_06465, partial [Pseudobutyrivibrio sp.]|nr:hypothetical protein [Pseudobutyrivibrio sp.]
FIYSHQCTFGVLPQRAFSAAVLAADDYICKKSLSISLSALQCAAIATKLVCGAIYLNIFLVRQGHSFPIEL